MYLLIFLVISSTLLAGTAITTKVLDFTACFILLVNFISFGIVKFSILGVSLVFVKYYT